jgi:glycosyltransferase involved in cell wall biosynthesis
MNTPPLEASLEGDSGAFCNQLTGVIPAYRCAPYLPSAVESLSATRIGRIVIAVDGGDSETLQVAEECQDRDPGRITVLPSNERLGAAGNVNRAVRLIDTPFFLKLDGDDILLPEFVAAAFPKITATADMALISGFGLRFTDVPAVPVHFLPDYTDAIPTLRGTEAYRFIVEWNPNPSSSGSIYRREAFLSVGGFDEQLVWGEDWEIWLRLAVKWAVAYAPVPSALYRIHAQSTTALVTHEDRLSDGYDAVYRQALRLCRSRELRPLLRRKFLKLVRAHLGATQRGLARGRAAAELARHIGQAFQAACTAATL